MAKNKSYNWKKWRDFQLDGLNESYDDDAAKKIADNFTRFLLGHPDGALGLLKKLKSKPVSSGVEMLGADEHGERFVALYNDLYKVIKKHMKSLDF